MAEVERDAAVLEQAGSAVLRVSIGWDGLEPQDDRFDFAFWDQFVPLMASKQVQLLPYVAYTPAWAAVPGPPPDQDSWRRPPRDPAEFGEVMEQLARRYRGRIRWWELWNEPDNQDYWLGSVEQYAELVRHGAEGVRRGDPEAQVVLGGLAGTVSFLTELFGEHAIGPWVDVVNVHAYFETWNPQPLERLTGYLAEVDRAVRKVGSRPIWLAEVGYSSHRRGAEVSPYYRASYDYEHTVPFQAVALARTVALALASPHVQLIAWYELKDANPSAPVIGDVNNRHLGVTFADHRPKPALPALAFLTRLFARGFRALSNLPVRRTPGDPATEVHGFQLPDGNAAVLAWIPTNTPGVRPPPTPDGNAADPRRARIEVALPCPAATPAAALPGPRAHLHDERGQPQGHLDLRTHAGSVGVGPLDIKAGTIAIALVTGCSLRRMPIGQPGLAPR